jgi:hypothetical protein
MMVIERDTLSRAETVTVAAVLGPQPSSRHAGSSPHSSLIRRRVAAELSPWIESARVSLVASFVRYER